MRKIHVALAATFRFVFLLKWEIDFKDAALRNHWENPFKSLHVPLDNIMKWCRRINCRPWKEILSNCKILGLLGQHTASCIVLLTSSAHDTSAHQMLDVTANAHNGQLSKIAAIRLQLICFHYILFNRLSSVLLTLIPFTTCQNLGCLPTMSLLSDNTAATITALTGRASNCRANDPSRQVRGKRETVNLSTLTVGAKKIQTLTYLLYKLFKKLPPPTSTGSAFAISFRAVKPSVQQQDSAA